MFRSRTDLQMNSLQFSVATLNITVLSDMALDTKDLFDPQPYNLNTSFYIQEYAEDKLKHTVQLKVCDTIDESSATRVKEEIIVSGDYSAQTNPQFNKQFGLFGNKGIVNHLILSELEKHGISVLHACAIIHPTTKHVVIGIGGSGSGKSVLVSNALSKGWKLIATEHVLVSSDGQLYMGNAYDNITPQALDFIKNALPKATLFEDRKMVEPIGSKSLADLTQYQFKEPQVQLGNNFTIALMKFGDERFKDGAAIEDSDFVLRCLQQVSSEKIASPVILNNDIIPSVLFSGDTQNRTKTITYLLNHAKEKSIVGGQYGDITQWLDKR